MPARHRRRARTARCGRSPADSGSRSAARCAGRHSCSDPGRAATPPASPPPGCSATGRRRRRAAALFAERGVERAAGAGGGLLVQQRQAHSGASVVYSAGAPIRLGAPGEGGSPAPRPSSAARQGAAPVPANAPPDRQRHAPRRRTPTASPPKPGTGGRPAPVPTMRWAGWRRPAVRARTLRAPGHRARPHPGHRRPLSRAASLAKQHRRRCRASPSVARIRAPSLHRVPAPKPRRHQAALLSRYARHRPA